MNLIAENKLLPSERQEGTRNMYRSETAGGLALVWVEVDENGQSVTSSVLTKDLSLTRVRAMNKKCQSSHSRGGLCASFPVSLDVTDKRKRSSQF